MLEAMDLKGNCGYAGYHDKHVQKYAETVSMGNIGIHNMIMSIEETIENSAGNGRENGVEHTQTLGVLCDNLHQHTKHSVHRRRGALLRIEINDNAQNDFFDWRCFCGVCWCERPRYGPR